MSAGKNIECLRDLQRPGGWWLLVDGSEQSFVDVDEPTHLEFEYVQLAADVVDASLPAQRGLAALHLGGGLCTVARWLAVARPGTHQQVAECSEQIAALAHSLPGLGDVEIVVTDALDLLDRQPARSLDLVVCDVYDGPETVTSPYTRGAMRDMSGRLRGGGLLVANLSDATPFALARVAAAAMTEAFDDVIVVAEPPVLRGRRSGNVVLAAMVGDELPVAEITRRAAGGLVRGRVLAGEDLLAWIGAARAVEDPADLPPSGESLVVRSLRGP